MKPKKETTPRRNRLKEQKEQYERYFAGQSETIRRAEAETRKLSDSKLRAVALLKLERSQSILRIQQIDFLLDTMGAERMQHSSPPSWLAAGPEEALRSILG